jgi:hypothetical protein
VDRRARGPSAGQGGEVADHREALWTAGDRIDVAPDGQVTVVKQAR